MNFLILNDVNSNTIQGLIIQNLPPITKPQIRTNIEEIDGRDGDIITKLGYSAYEKEFDIGLYGNYDVDQVISYFNSEGTVIFSNEDDKFYKYTIIEQIDFERLIRFKTAKVKMHVQPFKYSNTDTDIEIYATETDAEGTNLTINNTENGASFLDMQLKGQTTQDGTPTPSAPVNVNVVTGNTNVLISNKNLFKLTSKSALSWGINYEINNSQISLNGTTNGNSVNIYNDKTNYLTLKAGTYTISSRIISGSYTLSGDVALNLKKVSDDTPLFNISKGPNYTRSTTITLTQDTDVYLQIFTNATNNTFNNFILAFQIEVGNTATSYVAHQEQNYEINLGKNLIEDETFVQGGFTESTGTKRISCRNIKLKANTTYTFSSNINYSTYNVSIVTSTSQFPTTSFIYDSGWNTATFSFTTGNDDVYANIAVKKVGELVIAPSDVSAYHFQIEKGSTATSYAPYFTPIELCEINGYQDYIYKNNGNWFIHKEIGSYTFNGSENWYTVSTNQSGKYRSQFNLNNMLNGNVVKPSSNANVGLLLCDYYTNIMAGTQGTYGGHQGISIDVSGYVQTYTNDYNTNDISLYKTWLSTHNMKVYWVYATPIETQITDENLITQLEALRGASTYINQTNIITSGNLAPIIYVNVDTIDTNAIEVVNSGNIYSKPVVTITGLGTINLYLNDYQVFILELGDTETTITLDVENMEAYNINTGQLMNRQVTGDYNNFIFNSGTNIITWSGTIASVQIVNYSRWI